MKIKIWLIRHGMTAGNRQQRYVGTTDELLCEEGRQQIILKRQLINRTKKGEAIYLAIALITFFILLHQFTTIPFTEILGITN